MFAFCFDDNAIFATSFSIFSIFLTITECHNMLEKQHNKLTNLKKNGVGLNFW